jgi:hypothetical protein
MKYVLLFTNSLEPGKRWEDMPEDLRNQIYGRIFKWFEDNASVMREGTELQGVETATTVRFDENQRPIVMNGPFIEASEIVGGYSLVEVEDFEAALELAKSWPGGGAVEIRPIIDRSADYQH